MRNRLTTLTSLILAACLALAFIHVPRACAAETAKEASWMSASQKIHFITGAAPVTAPATSTFVWPFKPGGTLTDVVCTQITAGTTGTSVQFDVQKNGTTMLTTTGTITLAAGANITVDAWRNVAAVSGCVRPVVKPQGAAIRVTKGDRVTIVTTETGGYGTHPTYLCTAVFVPDL